MFKGDNFYFDGVSSVEDKRFEETFESIYTQDSLQVPWYIVAGNHDHHRNVTAQIAYSNVSPRWKFPSFYHSHVFKIPGTTKTLQLVLLDTVIFAGYGNDDGRQPPGKADIIWCSDN